MAMDDLLFSDFRIISIQNIIARRMKAAFHTHIDRFDIAHNQEVRMSSQHLIVISLFFFLLSDSLYLVGFIIGP